MTTDPRKYRFTLEFMADGGGIHSFISAVRCVDTMLGEGRDNNFFFWDWNNFLLMTQDLKKLDTFDEVYISQLLGVDYILSQVSCKLLSTNTAEELVRKKWYGLTCTCGGTNQDGSASAYTTEAGLPDTKLDSRSRAKSHHYKNMPPLSKEAGPYFEACHRNSDGRKQLEQPEDKVEHFKDQFSYFDQSFPSKIQTTNNLLGQTEQPGMVYE